MIQSYNIENGWIASNVPHRRPMDTQHYEDRNIPLLIKKCFSIIPVDVRCKVECLIPSKISPVRRHTDANNRSFTSDSG